MDKIILESDIISEIEMVINNNLQNELIKCAVLNESNQWDKFYKLYFEPRYRPSELAPFFRPSALKYLTLEQICQCLFVPNSYTLEETKEEKLIRRYNNLQNEDDRYVLAMSQKEKDAFTHGMEVAARTLGCTLI